MESGIYVGISAQIALEQRLTTLSHNMANARTTGFKAEEVRFEHLLSSSATKQIDFVTIGEMHIARHAGPVAGGPTRLQTRGRVMAPGTGKTE